MPDQTIMGHGSQILHTWAWQIMLAGFCPDDAPALSGLAIFSGDLCSARRSNLDECPNYKKFCSGFSSCNLWMCMNNLPCKLVPSENKFHTADGGIDRACRGDDIHDNSDMNYDAHINVATLENCKAICVYTPKCVGIEFNEAKARCEVWTKGIQITVGVAGFSCYRYTTLTTTQLAVFTLAGSPNHLELHPVECSLASARAATRCCTLDGKKVSHAEYGSGCHNEVTHAEAKRICEVHGLRLCKKDEMQAGLTAGTGCDFNKERIWTSSTCIATAGSIPFAASEAVEGFTAEAEGQGSACRGAHADDNLASYYTVHYSKSLQACKARCMATPVCSGIEFSTGRCELWTRSIDATRALPSFTCLRYTPLQRGSNLAVIQTHGPRESHRRRRRSLNLKPAVLSVA